MVKEKILIIDDNPVVARMTEALLVSINYEVVHARDGVSGIQMAKTAKPDVILLDIILPGMHGFEVCKQLKSDAATRTIPVVIISGTGLEEVAENEPDVQADAYLNKPFGLAELLPAIERAKEKIKKG